MQYPSSCRRVSVCVLVCVWNLFLLADLLRCRGDKGAGNGGQNSSLVANEFLIRATNGAVPRVWLEPSQSTRDHRAVTNTSRISWLCAGLRQTCIIIPLCYGARCMLGLCDWQRQYKKMLTHRNLFLEGQIRTWRTLFFFFILRLVHHKAEGTTFV